VPSRTQRKPKKRAPAKKAVRKRAAKKAARKRAPRKQGRPTIRNAAIERRILDGLAAGTPLTLICEPPNMPAWRTVYDWMAGDAGFSAGIARAREVGFDRIAREALAIADTPVEGVEITETPDGPRVKRGDMLGHRRLQVETRLKLLAKWDPKRYGERVNLEHTGPEGGPVRTEGEYRVTPEDEAMLKKIAATREQVAKG
jgi:hypothetical protein